MSYPPTALPPTRSDTTPTPGNLANDINQLSDAVKSIISLLGAADITSTPSNPNLPQTTYASIIDALEALNSQITALNAYQVVEGVYVGTTAYPNAFSNTQAAIYTTNVSFDNNFMTLDDGLGNVMIQLDTDTVVQNYIPRMSLSVSSGTVTGSITANSTAAPDKTSLQLLCDGIDISSTISGSAGNYTFTHTPTNSGVHIYQVCYIIGDGYFNNQFVSV